MDKESQSGEQNTQLIDQLADALEYYRDEHHDEHPSQFKKPLEECSYTWCKRATALLAEYASVTKAETEETDSSPRDFVELAAQTLQNVKQNDAETTRSVDEAAEAYGAETQEKLNQKFPGILPAWGPIAGAFKAGVEFAQRTQPADAFETWYDEHFGNPPRSRPFQMGDVQEAFRAGMKVTQPDTQLAEQRELFRETLRRFAADLNQYSSGSAFTVYKDILEILSAETTRQFSQKGDENG